MNEELNFDEGLRGIEDLAKLSRGEWTSQGEKKIVFAISELTLKHYVTGKDQASDAKLSSQLTYELTGKGTPSGNITIGKADDWPDIPANDGKRGFGYCEFSEQ